MASFIIELLERECMSNKKYTFVANWKMYFTTHQALSFAQEHQQSFVDLAKNAGHEIILCPSSLELVSIVELFKNTVIHVGSQDCSDYQQGAYTGQVSAVSLNQIGASHAIIGHSERRLYNGETDISIAKKVALLLDNHITPIVCIGEDAVTYQAGATISALEQQLALIIEATNKKYAHKSIYIAYEPVWAIGTGKIPSTRELSEIFNWLNLLRSKFKDISWRFMYGGSVSENTISSFTEIEPLDGFLVGGASLNFQAFKKIVSYH